jgi:copper homeostasis protein (lipoprotein)
MNTIKKTMKTLLASLFIFIIYMGCAPVFAESAGSQDAPLSQAHLNLSGLFLGFYPCSDCQGIRTTLALNKNNTYVYISIYIGKSDREFIEKGKYAVTENNTLVLTPRKGSTTTQQYLIEDDMLIKLDEDGNRITKDGADGYILRRKDVMKNPGNHSGH